jgi:C4-dicarboxylate transporter DctM subunit
MSRRISVYLPSCIFHNSGSTTLSTLILKKRGYNMINYETPLLLILVPLLYPLVIESGCGPIWFGVTITVPCMVGIVAPPVATNFFVVKGLLGDEVSMATIMKGIYIFLVPLTIGVILIIAFPDISTFLPSFMTY